MWNTGLGHRDISSWKILETGMRGFEWSWRAVTWREREEDVGLLLPLSVAFADSGQAASKSLWLEEHRWPVLASDTSRLTSPEPPCLPSAVLPPHIKWISAASNRSAEFRCAINTTLIDVLCSAYMTSLSLAPQSCVPSRPWRPKLTPKGSWGFHGPEAMLPPAPWIKSSKGSSHLKTVS